METVKVSWYPSLESLVQELKYPGFDNARASAFRRLPESEASALAAEYTAAYEARVSVIVGEREDSFSLTLRGKIRFSLTLRGKEFKGDLYCIDRAYDSWTTALVAPSGRVFVRHFGDTAEMSAFLDAETK